MKIMMMTNTYLPHVGGVARSIAAFTEEYRQRGHEVLVAAPEFDGQDPVERGVVRVSALQKFNGSDFSVMLPVGGVLDEAVETFEPDIIHAHHPFLVGASAQRLAATHRIPLVFTHHTLYEQYTHYTPADSRLLKRFVTALSTDYANLCDEVFAPSASIATILRQREVTAPITVVPTGVEARFFNTGSGAGMRAALGIPRSAFVIGHLGRLAPEKNLPFLADAVVHYLRRRSDAYFLVVGNGPAARDIRRSAREGGVQDRVILTGALDHPLLVSAYRAMDVFVFASQSETQGMVLTEAMAARTPVVAVDAPGARDVVQDGGNGRLLPTESVATFNEAIEWVRARPDSEHSVLCKNAFRTAKSHSLTVSADRALERYAALAAARTQFAPAAVDAWQETIDRISAEWSVIRGIAGAAGKALAADDDDEPLKAVS